MRKEFRTRSEQLEEEQNFGLMENGVFFEKVFRKMYLTSPSLLTSTRKQEKPCLRTCHTSFHIIWHNLYLSNRWTDLNKIKLTGQLIE